MPGLSSPKLLWHTRRVKENLEPPKVAALDRILGSTRPYPIPHFRKLTSLNTASPTPWGQNGDKIEKRGKGRQVGIPCHGRLVNGPLHVREPCRRGDSPSATHE